MINQLRHEACSGAIDDLAHVSSEDQLADALTKDKAPTEALVRAVATGVLPNVDKHPLFRDLMKHNHKAYLGSWILQNLENPLDVLTFCCEPIRQTIQEVWYATDDWHQTTRHAFIR